MSEYAAGTVLTCAHAGCGCRVRIEAECGCPGERTPYVGACGAPMTAVPDQDADPPSE